MENRTNKRFKLSSIFYALSSKSAQTLMEYIVLVGIVTVALVYMGTGLKRGTQSLIKVTADQIGNQQKSEQEVTRRTSLDNPADHQEPVAQTKEDAGFLVSAFTGVKTQNSKTVQEGYENLGQVTYTYNDITDVTTNSVTDLGYSKE